MRLGIGFAAGVFVLAACSGSTRGLVDEAGGRAHTATTATSSVTVSPAVDSSPPPPGPEMSRVFHPIGSTALTRPDGSSWFPLAVSPDGLVEVGVSPAKNTPAVDQTRTALVTPQGRVVWMSSDRVHGTARAWTGGDASRRWVVWVESAATTYDLNPWVMYSHDRLTGRTQMIARAPTLSGRTPPTVLNGTYPVIHRDRVYFAAVSRLRDGAPVPAVYSVPIGGSRPPRMEHRGVHTPQFQGSHLVYVRGFGGDWTILRDVGTEPETIASSSGAARFTGMAAASGILSWIEYADGTSHVHVLNDRTGHEHVYDTHTHLGYLEATSKYVAFSREGAHGYKVSIMDPSTGEVVAVYGAEVSASPEGFGSIAAVAVPSRDRLVTGRFRNHG